MSITIRLHVTHRRHVNGQPSVAVEGKTVGEALNRLISQYPGLKKELFDKDNQLLHYIEIYLNKVSAYPGELEKQIKDGDEIQIITFLAGG